MAETPSKKKGLGRGLSHLFGEAEAAYRVSAPEAPVAQPAPATGGSTLPVAFLRPGKFQPRRHFDEAALEELAGSIRHHGLLQPILVRPVAGQADAYEIIAGERRWRAAQRAALHDVPVVIQTLTDSQALEIALVENLQRQDLSALEEAEGYKRLMDEFGHSHAELGELVGKSRSHVANILRLLALPDSVKALVQSGELSAGHARALLTAPDPETLARTVSARNLSVRETERMANAAKDARRPAAKTAPAPANGKPVAKHADLLALERDMTERLGLTVTIEGRGSSGTLGIVYKSLDQLDEILAKLSRK
jgi:ParB family transcriptional regulator, chromosome partitioning protein